MKTHQLIASLMIISALLISLFPSASAQSTSSDTFYTSVSTLSTSTAKSDALLSSKDIQGNAHGPSDYSVVGNSTYILNTATLNDSGNHIMLFDHTDSSGNYVVYEATTLNQYDRVSHTIRNVSNLVSNGYVALRYNGIIS